MKKKPTTAITPLNANPGADKLEAAPVGVGDPEEVGEVSVDVEVSVVDSVVVDSDPLELVVEVAKVDSPEAAAEERAPETLLATEETPLEAAAAPEEAAEEAEEAAPEAALEAEAATLEAEAATLEAEAAALEAPALADAETLEAAAAPEEEALARTEEAEWVALLPAEAE